MADDDFTDDVPEPDPGDIDEDDLEGFSDESEFDDDDVDLLAGDDDSDDVIAGDEAEVVSTAVVVAAEEGDDEEEDDDDEPDPDDVEADLDTILKDRLVATEGEEPDDEEAEPEPDERGDGDRIQPKGPKEFVCASCFLVKHVSMRVNERGRPDPDGRFCSDCV